MRKHVPILSSLRSKTAQRFYRKLRPDGSCIVFSGCRNPHGYGIVDTMTKGVRRPILAHRLAWALHHKKEPPQELSVCHACNNPPCCNPKHLYLGTAQDNTDDRKMAGTIRRGFVGHWRGKKGYDHPRSHTNETRLQCIQLLRHDLHFGRISKATGVGHAKLAAWWREWLVTRC